jgi:DNA-binding NtrC family response regulator
LWIGQSGAAALEEAARVFELETASGVAEALQFLEASRVDAVVAGFPLPDWTAPEALEAIRRASPGVPVVAIEENATAPSAVRLARLGAWQVFGAEVESEVLLGEIERAAEDGRRAPAGSGDPWRRFLVGESRAIEDVCRIVRLVGPRRATVLITGETGTGKEMAARAIHAAGPRGHLPMVAVSCSALPENLLEAELFGHVRGAFTGAVANRVGRFEQAHNSTLFLDEVGEMPLDVQAKLLRVLQEREFQRLGSSETVRADVRVIAATNADLAERVRQGRFREDLYYRLNVAPLRMPPLRERPHDIPMLARHFLEKICRAEGIAAKRAGRDVLDWLMRQPWPGNVRQLENAIETAVALSGSREELEPADFPPAPERAHNTAAPRGAPVVAVPDEGLDFERTVSHFERSLLEQALRKAGGNKTAAADMLRLKRTTLAAKLRSFEDGWRGAASPAGSVVH